MHDEFSALFRTDFLSFEELINQGVKIEGHPPAVQVFLYYWIKLVGSSAFALKLPFALMGFFSVFIVWKIASDWFEKSAALVISLFLSSLQYFIFYSQIIRPYIFGLFFVLLTVYFWNKFIKSSEQKVLIKNGIYYAFFGSIAALSHHFALLQIATIGLFGMFLVNKKTIWKYFAFNLLLIIFYSPNFKIFFTQLGYGGIEAWLAKPTNTYILEYLYYCVHFSPILIFTILIVLVFGLTKVGNEKTIDYKIIITSFLWFVVPFLVGYYYSVYKSAVLQHSVLIFSFPFLLFAIFGWIRNNSNLYKLVSVFSLTIVIVFSLVFERKHYSVFYKSSYEQTILKAIESKTKYSKDCLIVFSNSTFDSTSTSTKIFDYYISKFNINIDMLFIDKTTNYKELQNAIKNFKGNYLQYGFLSNANPEIYTLIHCYFPYTIKTDNFFGGNAVLFSKIKPKEVEDERYISINTFENQIQSWSDPNKLYLYKDSLTGSQSYVFDNVNEWGVVFNEKLKSISSTTNFIDVSVDVFPLEDISDALLVSSIEQDTIIIDWRSSSFNWFNLEKGKWNKVVHSIKLADLNLKGLDPSLKIFIWNKNLQQFRIDNFKIEERKVNPYLYWIAKKEID